MSHKVVRIATKRILAVRPTSEPSDGISALTSLLQKVLKIYTDGTFRVVGLLIDQTRGVATRRAAAGIVATYPFN